MFRFCRVRNCSSVTSVLQAELSLPVLAWVPGKLNEESTFRGQDPNVESLHLPASIG